MADEVVDVIDEENNVVGQALRSEVHSKGLRHRISAVLIKNKEGEYLIPTAADNKTEAGKLFHSAGGHVLSGKKYPESAARELEEETGIKVLPGTLQYLGSFWVEKEYPGRMEKERFEVYEADYNPGMGKVVLNEEQVNEQWMSKEDLRMIYKKNPEKLSFPLLLSCRMIFGF